MRQVQVSGLFFHNVRVHPLRCSPVHTFSRKLSASERNYDVGNRELLAMKAAMEEWCHWLEGARHPFTVLTDHKNIEYLRSAKRLNPRQTRWALFFTRFHFTVTYRPGSSNVKADALSRLDERTNHIEGGEHYSRELACCSRTMGH